MSLFDVNDLEAFIAVARGLHFGRAAERLSTRQSSVSRRVRRLEDRLGVALFERSTRSVRLTAAGDVLLDGADALLASVRKLEDGVQRAAQGAGRRFHVAYVASAVIEAVPALAQQVRKSLPDAALSLTELHDEDVTARVVGGDIDMGLARVPVRAAGVQLEELYREPLAAVVPGRHRLAEEDHVPLAALADEPWVFWPERMAPSQHRTLWLLCRRAGFTPTVAQEASSVPSMLALVAAGLGVGVVAACYAKQAPSDVAIVALDGVSLPLLLAFRRDRALELEPLLACARALRPASPTRRARARR